LLAFSGVSGGGFVGGLAFAHRFAIFVGGELFFQLRRFGFDALAIGVCLGGIEFLLG
jgi:hypothetical protein